MPQLGFLLAGTKLKKNNNSVRLKGTYSDDLFRDFALLVRNVLFFSDYIDAFVIKYLVRVNLRLGIFIL